MSKSKRECLRADRLEISRNAQMSNKIGANACVSVGLSQHTYYIDRANKTRVIVCTLGLTVPKIPRNT